MNKKIYLASKSPRRKELLERAGFEVEILLADVDEDYPDSLEENEIAEYIAIKKTEPFIGNLPQDGILVTADSIVVLDGVVYGKPTSKEDAINTLEKLSGNIHKVYTGVCIMNSQKKKSFTSLSEIKFSNLTLEEIEFYLDTDKPYDKAGSYGIQDWIGLCKVEWIKGTYTNIMGLPVNEVYEVINVEF